MFLLLFPKTVWIAYLRYLGRLAVQDSNYYNQDTAVMPFHVALPTK